MKSISPTESSSAASRIAAPAPSPKITQVARSAYSDRHIEKLAAGTIDFVNEVDQPDGVIFGGFQNRRARTVPEDHAGGAVGVVDDRRHYVGANHEYARVYSAGNELRSHLHGVEKGRAGGGKIESPRSLRAQLVLHHAGCGRKKHVRGDRADNDEIDVGGSKAALRECFLGGFHGEVACGNAFLRDVALANADAGHDPLVVGVDHFFQVGISRSE